MSYSTGSGDYIALMNAVLAFAVADGWTTTGGNWPISKGVVRGVDWTTFTQNEPDFTLLGGANRAARYIRISVGSSPANATANAASSATSALVPNMDRTFTSWHIFSDPGVGKPDYIHVVVQFSNGVDPSCWGQFSFGEIDRNGMTHTGCAFAASNIMRAYVGGNDSSFITSQSRDWNGGLNGRNLGPFTGTVGLDPSTRYYNNVGQSLVVMIDGTVSPIPASGWPAVNTILGRDNFLNMTSFASQWPGGAKGRDVISSSAQNKSFRYATMASCAKAQPYSGAISTAPFHLVVMNGSSNSARAIFLGTFPGVRNTSVEDYGEGDEVTFASDTYKLFPYLVKKDFSTLETNQVTSGYMGLAYKKVA